MQKINSGVTAPKGFLAGGVHCGVKTNNTAKKDIAIIYSEKPCTAAAVYTQNKVFGSTHHRNQTETLQNGMAQAVVCNSGNAKHLAMQTAVEKAGENVYSGSRSTASEAGGYHCSLYRCHRGRCFPSSPSKRALRHWLPSFPEKAIWMPCRPS